MPVMAGWRIKTESEMTRKARYTVHNTSDSFLQLGVHVYAAVSKLHKLLFVTSNFCTHGYLPGIENAFFHMVVFSFTASKIAATWALIPWEWVLNQDTAV